MRLGPIGLLLAATPLLALPALAGELAGGNTASGHRITAEGAGTGVGISQRFVVGSDGGTNVTEISGGLRIAEFRLGVALPFTTYRTPLGRDQDLGNLQISSFYSLPVGPLDQSVGLEVHFNIGDHAWTWANAPDELWPGAGVDVVWEGRLDLAVTVMLRGALGMHSAADYDPFPDRYGRFQLAAGLDYGFGDRFGVVAETSIQYWDTSPWELAALARADVMPGLRLRTGFVLPLAVWAGLTPVDQPGGVREATLLFDAAMVF